MRTKGLLTDEEFLVQKSMLSEKRSALESRFLADRVTEAEIRQQFREITEPLANLGATWHGLRDPFRRRFERYLLPVGFAYGKIGTAELGLLFRVFDDFLEGESNAVALVKKFWNRILQEISDFLSLLKHAREEKERSEGAVPKNAKE